MNVNWGPSCRCLNVEMGGGAYVFGPVNIININRWDLISISISISSSLNCHRLFTISSWRLLIVTASRGDSRRLF